MLSSLIAPVARCYAKLTLLLLIISLGLILGSIAGDCFAAGQDILKGAEVDASATLKGTGRTLFYIIEIVVAVATYIKSRNMMVFLGMVVLMLVFSFFIKLAGI